MTWHPLDVVVLTQDLPAHGLRAGDLGAVVEVYAADAIGIRGIIVHAISEEAKKFYLALGFDPCPGEPMTLVVTLADLRAALE